MYTLLYLKWITIRDLLDSTGNSAQCYVTAWMGGKFGGEWIQVGVRLSPFAVHLKLPQHCSSAIAWYKIKSILKSGSMNKEGRGYPVDCVGFPDSSFDKESAWNARYPGSIPGLGREGIGYPLQYSWASLVAQLVKNLPAMCKTWVRSLGWEDPLEKGTATHSSILAWRIPWTV